jgi:hypothetical protein
VRVAPRACVSRHSLRELSAGDPVGSTRRTRSRTLFPRIKRPSPSAARSPSSRLALRPAVTGRLWRPGSDAASCRGNFSPRCAAPRAATLTRIVSLALFGAHELRVARGVHSLAARSVALVASVRTRVLRVVRDPPPSETMSLAADSRRARYQLLRTADLSGNRAVVSGAFSNFAVHFRARRRREIYARAAKSRRNLAKRNLSYPPCVASV